MLSNPNPAYSQKILIKLILGIMFVVTLVWWTFTPSDGEQEFRRSQQALRHVTSWREEVPAGGTFQEQMEVSCIDQRAHLLRQSSAPGSGMTLIDERTRIGATGYSQHAMRYEQNPMNDSAFGWQKTGYGFLSIPCTQFARLQSGYSFPDYERLIRTAVISRGDKEYIHGAVCRNWKAKVVRSVGGEAEEVCIGVDDHLPYRYRTGGVTYLLYAWNEPVSIDEPTVVEQPRPVPYLRSLPTYRAYDNYQQREPEPPMRYISPNPPPLPMPAVPPPPPPVEDDDPRGI